MEDDSEDGPPVGDEDVVEEALRFLREPTKQDIKLLSKCLKKIAPGFGGESSSWGKSSGPRRPIDLEEWNMLNDLADQFIAEEREKNGMFHHCCNVSIQEFDSDEERDTEGDLE
ncbi:hypothetical protein AAG570_010649 [Ranatra chinensis]|uniref:Uncharacterized protein n=1 Tax=Ranatra chinensis TaxID=642074 RepID=A0ABD0Z185_9HEMI